MEKPVPNQWKTSDQAASQEAPPVKTADRRAWGQAPLLRQLLFFIQAGHQEHPEHSSSTHLLQPHRRRRIPNNFFYYSNLYKFIGFFSKTIHFHFSGKTEIKILLILFQRTKHLFHRKNLANPAWQACTSPPIHSHQYVDKAMESSKPIPASTLVILFTGICAKSPHRIAMKNRQSHHQEKNSSWKSIINRLSTRMTTDFHTAHAQASNIENDVHK